MSYDLIIFEKSNMPTGRTGFLNWYDKKMECDDGQDISFTSEKLQKAFHALRNIFSPINGSFAPGNKVLSETPEMKKYLCDYFITEDMISLSFSYSIVEFAYNTVKRAAYFWMLVFFNPNDSSFPMFLGNRCPMLLEGQWFQPKEIDRFDSVKEKLSSMTVKNRSYLYVTDQIGNYIQVGGYKDSFTVEKRVYMTPTAYTHCKAGYCGTGYSSNLSAIIIAGNSVKLKQNQILSKFTVEQLFLDFFQNVETVSSIEWTEMDM